VEKTAIFSSRGELRRLIDGGGVNLNKEKATSPDQTVTADDLISDKYLLVQKGKKNFHLIRVI